VTRVAFATFHCLLPLPFSNFVSQSGTIWLASRAILHNAGAVKVRWKARKKKTIIVVRSEMRQQTIIVVRSEMQQQTIIDIIVYLRNIEIPKI
jgi:predicted alpha/beta superfamily hydrolase